MPLGQTYNFNNICYVVKTAAYRYNRTAGNICSGAVNYQLAIGWTHVFTIQPAIQHQLAALAPALLSACLLRSRACLCHHERFPEQGASINNVKPMSK